MKHFEGHCGILRITAFY